MTSKQTEKPAGFIEWLSKHWFLLVFVVGSGAVWGQYQMKVDKLEDAVKQWSSKEEATRKLQSQTEMLEYRSRKLEEQNKQIMDAQAQQSKDIQTLIILQQQTLKGVNNNGQLARQQLGK